MLASTFLLCLLFSVAALIRQKPSSVIVEEGENVNLECKASGLPKPTVTWRKAFGSLPRGKTTVIDGNMTMLSVTKEDRGTYVCTVKNLLGEESAFSVVTVIDKNLPQNHTIFSNGTLFVKKVTTNDAGSYTCVAKNYQQQ